MTTATPAEIAATIYDHGLPHVAHLPADLRAVAVRVAIEVAELVAGGTIPATAASWGELASYVDGDELGSVEDTEMEWDTWTEVTDAVDNWLAELPFTGGAAGVTVGARVAWCDTPTRQGGGGVVTAVDGATVIVTTDDDVPVVFGTVHPRAEILRRYLDVGAVTGYLADLILIETTPLADLLPELPVIDPAPAGTTGTVSSSADATVIHIEWTETVTHRTALTLPELRTALAAALAEDPYEDSESLAFVAGADAATLVDLLREADACADGAVGEVLARRNGRDAVKVSGREITSVTAD